MNIEIANRLVQLRKQHGLSQEELAAKLGLSLQAVSKWERAEASPDTDNLILLARLYQVSLDDLLKTEDDIPSPEDPDAADADGQTLQQDSEEASASGGADGEPEPAPSGEDKGKTEKAEWETNKERWKADWKANKEQWKEEFKAQQKDWKEAWKDGSADGNDVGADSSEGPAHVKFDGEGIHIDGKDKVHIGWKGIHVLDHKGDEVHVAWNGVHVVDHKGDEVHIGAPPDKHIFKSWKGYENPSKLGRFLMVFPYPLLLIVAYLLMGVFLDLWHPGWLVFFTIPVYDHIATAVQRRYSFGKFMRKLPFGVIACGTFLLIGCVTGIWHPTWALLLLIPIYHWVANALHKAMKEKAPVR